MKPQLTIRDLFWLVLVCAVALGWLLDRGMLNAVLQEYHVKDAIRQIEESARNDEVRGTVEESGERIDWSAEWQPPPGTLRDGFQLDAF